MTSIEQEQENFLRNAILVVDHSKDALISLIELDLRNKHLTFEQFLNRSQHEIYHLCYNNGRCCRCLPGSSLSRRKRIIFPSQMEILFDKAAKMCGHRRGPDFCCSLAKKGIGTDVLDLTLARCLLVNCCTDVFWYSCLQFQGISFEDFLNQNKHLIYHLWQYNQRCCHCPIHFQLPVNYQIINTHQWNAMFTGSTGLPVCRKRSYTGGTNCICSISAISGISQGNLDIFLQQTILEYCCSNRKSVETLVKIRNNVYGHTKAARISDSDYTGFKNDIESAVLDIAVVCRKEPEFKTALNDVNYRSLDHNLLVQYQNSLLNRTNDIAELFALAQSSQKSMEQTMTKMQTLQETTANLMESSKKADEHTAAKLQKLEEKTEITNSVIESSKKAEEYTASKLQKLEEKTETMHSILESNQKAEEHTSSKLQKLDESILCTSQRLETVETETKKVKEYVSKCETSKRSRLIGLTQTEIDGHLKKGTFVETPAVQACIKLLETSSILILTGAAGTGKSRNSLEILHQFRIQHPEFKLVKLTDLHDFTDCMPDDEKLVVLFEDIFGRTNARFSENTDIQIIDRLHACTINGNIKVILTVRDTIRMSCEWILNSHPIFHGKFEVDLSSEKFKMTETEKESLLLKYFVAHNFRLLDYNNDLENFNEEAILDPRITVTVNRVTLRNIVESEPLLGFPEACSLFTGNRKFTRLGLSFFKHPLKYLYEEIEKLRENGKDNEHDRMSYVTLVYILLNDGVLDQDGIELNICIDILESCYGFSNTKLPACLIIDAANEMIGRYLIFHSDDGTYQLQHQTIFESLLISYSRINRGLIISRLSFEFIREMVRLQNYTLREGEVVMKITPKYYPMLTNRIIEIIHSEYFRKSLSLNFQLLCKSEIIKENDECFMTNLIEKAHDACMKQEYSLQRSVTCNGNLRFFNLYLPVLFLEQISQLNNMNKSIILLLDHITSILDSETEENIVFACKSSLIETCSHVCEFKNNENMHIRRKTNEILIKLILEKVNHGLLDLKKITNKACCRGCLEIVTCLLENTDHKKLHIMEAVNAVYSLIEDDSTNIPFYTIYDDQREKYEPLIRLISEKVNHELLDLNKIFHKACSYWYLDVVTFVLKNIDHKKLYIEKAVSAVYSLIETEYDYYEHYQSEKYEPFFILILEKVNHELHDLKKIFHKACYYSYINVYTLMLEKCDKKKLNIMEQVNIVFSSRDWFSWDSIVDHREQYEPLIKLIVEKVNHDLLNLKTVFKESCYFEFLDVVMFLIENTDPTKLDIMEAVNILNLPKRFMCEGIHEREKYKRLIKLILVKVDHELLNLKEIMYKACRYGISEVVTFVLENIDHGTIDIMKAVKILYKSMWYSDDRYHYKDRYEHLINLILNKVNHDLLDLKTIMNNACEYECVDVVTFAIENIDHKKIDIVEINTKMIKSSWSIGPKRTKYEHFFKLILHKVNHELLDLKRILDLACAYNFFDVITHVIENTDIEKIVLEKIVNENFRGKKDAPLIRFILDKVNHAILDLREIFNKAYRYGCLDLVSYVIENIDHKKIDIKEAVKQAYDQLPNTRFCNEEVINLLLQKVNIDLFDTEVLMNEACGKGYLNVVRWLVKKVVHSNFDIHTAINVSIFYSYGHEILKIFFENISHNLFDIGLVIEEASSKNKPLIVLWLLKTMDNSLFDMTYVFKKACRYGNLQIVKYVFENIDNSCFDVRSVMNRACCFSESYSLAVVKLLLKYSKPDMYDLGSAMNNACRNGNVRVVKWFWNNLDRKLFNVKTAWNNACYNCNVELLSYLLNNMDENMLDKSYSMSQACQSHRRGDEVISLLFETQHMNTPENCKKVLTEACLYCNSRVVGLLLARTDFEPLEYKEALINTIKAKMNITDYRYMYQQIEVFNAMLTDKSLKKLGPKDISEVMEVIVSKGELYMLQQLWGNTEHSMCDMRAIVNTACESGKFKIVDWLLQNIKLKNIDVQTVIVKSCGYGWLKIVKLLWSELDITNSVIETSMDEACSYGRYEIVDFLLENVDSKLLDTKLILEKACGYGWKDIILRLFDNIDNIYIDPKACMVEACAQGRLEIVELFFSKYDANNFDLDTLIGKACKSSDNSDVTRFLIQNFDLKKSHVDVIIKNACKHSWTEIVKSFLDVCKHYKNLMEEAMANACNSGVTEMVKLLLDHVDVNFPGVQTAFIISCQKGWDEIVCLLLEHVDYSLFDFTVAMNEACRCGEENIVKLLIQKVNRKHFNFDTAIVEACKSNLYEDLVLVLIKYIDHLTSNIEAIYKKARGYKWRRVISRLKRMSCNEN